MDIHYQVEVREVGEDALPIYDNITPKTLNVSTLVASVPHEFRVRGVEVNSGIQFGTVWSAWEQFNLTVPELFETLGIAPSTEVAQPVILGFLTELTLLGDVPHLQILGDAYVEAGATAIDPIDGDITGNIVISGDTVDVNTSGIYTVIYTVINSALLTTVITREVHVAIPQAAISYNIEYNEIGQSTTATTSATSPKALTGLIPDSNYQFRVQAQGVSALGSWSAYTAFVTESLGPVDFTLTPATDTEVAQPISVEAEVLPAVITIVGASPYLHVLGEAYVDEGATAFDSIDGDITGDIVVTGDTVDVNTATIYTIIYTVTNTGALITVATREVHVAVPEVAVSYNVEYKEIGQSTTAITVDASPELIESLNQDSNYEFRVQAKGASALSAWTEYTAFSTLALDLTDFTLGSATENELAQALVLEAEVLTEVNFTLTAATSVEVAEVFTVALTDVSWEAATAWDVEVENLTSPEIVTYSDLDSTTLNLTDLNGSSDYRVRVRGLISAIEFISEWTDYTNFTTEALPLTDINLTPAILTETAQTLLLTEDDFTPAEFDLTAATETEVAEPLIAELTETVLVAATSWDIEFIDLSTGDVTYYLNTANPLIVTDLDVSGEYRYRVKGYVSSPVAESEWSDYFDFITAVIPVVNIPIGATLAPLDIFDLTSEYSFDEVDCLILGGTLESFSMEGMLITVQINGKQYTGTGDFDSGFWTTNWEEWPVGVLEIGSYDELADPVPFEINANGDPLDL